MKVVPLVGGSLALPGSFQPRSGPFTVSMHFLGGNDALMQKFCDIGFNAVHYNSSLTGRSQQFKEPFLPHAEYFGEILEAIEGAVRQQCNAPDARVGNIAVSSFSAGYGAVREILKVPEYFERIQTLFLLDTVYAGWVSDEVRVPQVEQMIDFMRFAQAAARREKRLIVSHIDYDCDDAGYCSTRKTAELLLASVGGTRQPAHEDLGLSRPPTNRCDIGDFHLLHYADEDHGYQLRMLPEIWRIFGLGNTLA